MHNTVPVLPTHGILISRLRRDFSDVKFSIGTAFSGASKQITEVLAIS